MNWISNQIITTEHILHCFTLYQSHSGKLQMFIQLFFFFVHSDFTIERTDKFTVFVRETRRFVVTQLEPISQHKTSLSCRMITVGENKRKYEFFSLYAVVLMIWSTQRYEFYPSATPMNMLFLQSFRHLWSFSFYPDKRSITFHLFSAINLTFPLY